ncbi:MAG: hypothetical protein IT234_07315 [Bacteroidia bacterium]|nr:hypothetical protein [Bacteroidia bacterium]
MKTKKIFYTVSIIALSFLFVLSCTPELEIPEPSAGDANFSKTIAIGGNYMAGTQDGALFQQGQRLSIPALLAEQFKLVGGNIFSQALMPDNNGLGVNSKPWEGQFVTPSHLGNKTDCKGVTSLSPLKSIISASGAAPYLTGIAGNSVHNLSVPYANLVDYFNPALGNSIASGNTNPYYNRFASNPGVSTLFNDIKTQNATFFSAWLGMEDIYNYASVGGTSTPIPSSSTFSNTLDTILGALTTNGAKGVIATIPDFRTFPYYTLVKWDNADITQVQADSLNYLWDTLSGLSHIHFVKGRNGFIINDVNAPFGLRQMKNGEYITLSVPLDSMKCFKYGLLVNTVNNRYVLDSTEVYKIDQAINSYNAVITQKAAQYNLALVDMHSYFNSVVSGIKWDGADFNAVFVSGGFFSLDGYHPNQKGYALIANEFIKAINTKYNAVIPTINCVECNGILFP